MCGRNGSSVCRSAGMAHRPRSPTPWLFSSPTKRATSTVKYWPSMAASSMPDWPAENDQKQIAVEILPQEHRMPKLSRRHVTIGAGALAVTSFSIGRARAAEFTYKYANNLPLTHPMNKRAQEAAAKIKDETKGRFELQIFPSSQLGSDTDTLGQIRSGAVDFFTLSGLILSTYVPAASINGIGFAFKDYDSVWKAMDGKLGEFVRGEIAKSRTIFAFEKPWDNGFRQTTTSLRPIVSPADLANLKIRVPPAPLWTSMFKAFGAPPTTINFNEVSSALQSKVCDAQENPLAVIETAKLYEVQTYCSLTNHMWDGFWFLANKANWDALPADTQASITKNINAAGLAERADVAKLAAT